MSDLLIQSQPASYWVNGAVRSGKTQRLIALLIELASSILPHQTDIFPLTHTSADLNKHILSHQSFLVFAATADQRQKLLDRIAIQTSSKYSIRSTTPLGFMRDEVILFWPLLLEILNLPPSAGTPLPLRPETEQELATKFCSPFITDKQQTLSINIDRQVRRVLDLYQLAAFSGTALEEIPNILNTGLTAQELGEIAPPLLENLGNILTEWRSWCLSKGLLTYGLICQLYAQSLLPNPTYQQYLINRYPVVLADDLDEYPAIARFLLENLLDQGGRGVFTFNPMGSVRFGLGADPEYLAKLQHRCQIETLSEPDQITRKLAPAILDFVLNGENEEINALSLPTWMQAVKTQSRADLLKETANTIINAIASGEVLPEQIAVIAPGLDMLARYTLITLLNHAGIVVQPLKEQRPLISYPLIRALLTLLTLVYPGLGRLVDRQAIAEMLIVFSQNFGKNRSVNQLNTDDLSFIVTSPEAGITNSPMLTEPTQPIIDPVRAGLLADYCFVPDLENPHLLDSKTFQRWDRLGHQASQAYEQIRQWIEQQRSQQTQGQILNPVFLLDRAIQKFYLGSDRLVHSQLSALRELMERAIHYEEIENRLTYYQDNFPYIPPANIIGQMSPWSREKIGQFIQMLQRGIISANPYPVKVMGKSQSAVTLATIFQYRNQRSCHPWQFWLDVGSPLWLSSGSANLFAFPLFLQSHLGNTYNRDDITMADQDRLRRILLDLLSRLEQPETAIMGPQILTNMKNSANIQRIWLCHSELAVNGQEQTGPLLPLITSLIS